MRLPVPPNKTQMFFPHSLPPATPKPDHTPCCNPNPEPDPFTHHFLPYATRIPSSPLLPAT